jgi:hypothetical protein
VALDGFERTVVGYIFANVDRQDASPIHAPRETAESQ